MARAEQRLTNWVANKIGLRGDQLEYFHKLIEKEKEGMGGPAATLTAKKLLELAKEAMRDSSSGFH